MHLSVNIFARNSILPFKMVQRQLTSEHASRIQRQKLCCGWNCSVNAREEQTLALLITPWKCEFTSKEIFPVLPWALLAHLRKFFQSYLWRTWFIGLLLFWIIYIPSHYSGRNCLFCILGLYFSISLCDTCNKYVHRHIKINCTWNIKLAQLRKLETKAPISIALGFVVTNSCSGWSCFCGRLSGHVRNCAQRHSPLPKYTP